MASPLRQDQHNDIHPTDLHVGNRLRMRRLSLNLTQEKLASLVGLTFQQVQKYEHGANRISASRLHEIAQALKVPVNYFFEQLDIEQPSVPGMGESGQDAIDGLDDAAKIDMASRETADLVRSYYRIEDPKKRKKILDLIRAMSDEA
ncbi:MAG: helix-turn-helix transcriptional regulator [Alphaproteobacteria bacterium]|nr:helix-turn-helix transcriptional regulator [Alphaproteobacteria bacterium]